MQKALDSGGIKGLGVLVAVANRSTDQRIFNARQSGCATDAERSIRSTT